MLVWKFVGGFQKCCLLQCAYLKHVEYAILYFVINRHFLLIDLIRNLKNILYAIYTAAMCVSTSAKLYLRGNNYKVIYDVEFSFV